MSRMRIDPGKIVHAREVIPKEDFVAAQYDTSTGAPLRRLVLILSAPRSGSTLLCDLCRINDVCLPHEYFQTQHYLPLLADRWGCIVDGRLDRRAFVDALIAHRVSADGVLGINLQGGHIPTFGQFEDLFGDVPVEYIVIRRRDTILQSVSYELAAQTRRWSSAFEAQQTPRYSFDRILRRVQNLDRQYLLVEAFLRSRDADHVEIAYEDLARQPAAQLRRLEAFRAIDTPEVGTGLKQQASDLNEDWARHFAADLMGNPRLREVQNRRRWICTICRTHSPCAWPAGFAADDSCPRG